jgi:hypothetical protein
MRWAAATGTHQGFKPSYPRAAMLARVRSGFAPGRLSKYKITPFEL